VAGFAHFWSLAVEEQFYLLWPLALHRMRPERVLRLCLGICVAAFGFRTAMRVAGFSSECVYEFTICRMDALAMGAALRRSCDCHPGRLDWNAVHATCRGPRSPCW